MPPFAVQRASSVARDGTGTDLPAAVAAAVPFAHRRTRRARHAYLRLLVADPTVAHARVRVRIRDAPRRFVSAREPAAIECSYTHTHTHARARAHTHTHISREPAAINARITRLRRACAHARELAAAFKCFRSAAVAGQESGAAQLKREADVLGYVRVQLEHLVQPMSRCLLTSTRPPDHRPAHKRRRAQQATRASSTHASGGGGIGPHGRKRS